jgi:CzcA family heavy metal efflux pump
MNYVAFVERHRRSIILVLAAFTIAGALSAFSLPVGLFPNVTFPRIQVALDAGDRPAQQMALFVTQPVEQALRGVPGILNIRSGTSRGSANINLDFGWGRDMVATTLQVNAAVGQVLPSLPAGTNYRVQLLDPTTFPIIAYGLTSETLTQPQLRDLVQFQIIPLLSGVSGVSRVDFVGGAKAEIHVIADPHRLQAYGLTLDDMAKELKAANVLNAVGHLEDHNKLYLVVADNTLHRVDDIKNVVVKSDDGKILRIGDIAEVTEASQPVYVRVVEDGYPAVLFQVYEQPGGNAVQIANDVKKKLAAFRMPAGVRVAKWYDQSELVTDSAVSVRDAVLIGLVLAGLVLLVFLRSFRTTLVAVIVVPASLIMTVLVLSLLGFSFNIMTLGGIAAAVGLVIDDAIVMVEHIARRAGVRDGTGGAAAVLPAGQEFMRPLTGSSLATCIVFIPLSFLGGVTGAFSKALSITMGSALLISYLVSAFAVPVLARTLIDYEKWHDPHAGHEGWFGRMHRSVLGGFFERPWILVVVVIPLLGIGWLSYNHVGTGFIPPIDEGGFVLDYVAKPGTSLAETNRELSQVEEILTNTADVQTFSRRTGLGLGGTDLNEPNQGDFFVKLKPAGTRRPIEQVMDEIGDAATSSVPGLDIDTAQLMEDLIGDLTAVPQPIEIKISSTDPTKLIPQARKVAAAIKKIKGVVEVQDGVILAGDGLNIKVDPIKAAFEGVGPDDVQAAVETFLSGTVATTIADIRKQTDVRVWVPEKLRSYDEDIGQLPIRAADGHIFPLQRVATVTADPGQPEIDRENLQEIRAVNARIENRDLGSTIADVRKVLEQPGMFAPGVTYEFGGVYQQQQIAFFGLALVFVAALIAEFILLLFLYERVWLPIIIIGTSLLSTTAVFTGLWITHVELNITALIGMTMVIGIATEMSIFYVSEFTELRAIMPSREALIEAARNRMRPIAMTTLAAIFTLLPLALALGQGAAMQQPLAIAIIAGLMLQFPLVLLAMPVLIGLTLRREPDHHFEHRRR